jgi:hypothetical protein
MIHASLFDANLTLAPCAKGFAHVIITQTTKG